MSAYMGHHLMGAAPKLTQMTSYLQRGILVSKACRFTSYQPTFFAASGQCCRQISRTFHGNRRINFHPGSCLSGQFLTRHADLGKYQIMLKRLMSSKSEAEAHKMTKTFIMYICATGIFMLGMAYAGVPLYRIFCTATGLGGKPTKGHDVSVVETMTPVEDRVITIRFNADVHSAMRWNFRPQQIQVKVSPGETALAFYSAKNSTDKPIVGISTYNIIPFEAGQYFNKIQCFCFEEQRLNPHEQVDMPVFFFIDPEYAEDPKLENVDQITLSYTFFEAKDGLNLPLPGYMQPHQKERVAAAS